LSAAFLFPNRQIQPEEATMLGQHELNPLSDANNDTWTNVSFARPHVRVRVGMAGI
jgi:hypothetical protein